LSKRPAVFLFFLAPFLAEFLLGASTLSHWQGIIPVILLYGGGSVFIREIAARMGGRPLRVLFLGFIFGIIEEGFIFQTLFHPSILGVDKIGGRYLGINWIFTVWVLGYHAVWSILLPIYTTEIIFPSASKKPCLGKVGLGLCFLSYLVGAVTIGHFIRTNFIHGFKTPGFGLFFVGTLIFVAILGLINASRLQKNISVQPSSQSALVFGAGGLVTSILWFALLYLPNFLKDGIGVFIVLIAWPIFGFLMARRLIFLLEAAAPWVVTAIVFGALFISSLHGFRMTSGNPVDHLSQGLAALVTLTGLFVFARRLAKRSILSFQ